MDRNIRLRNSLSFPGIGLFNIPSQAHTIPNPMARWKGRSIKTVKEMMKKAAATGSDPWLCLLDYRNTLTEGLQSSPVQRLMGRRTKTRLPTTTSLLRPEIYDESEAIRRQKLKQAHYYSQGSKDLQQLKSTQIVRIQPHGQHKTWRKAMVTKQVGIRSYEVETEGGTYLRRNRRQLRATAEDHNTSTADRSTSNTKTIRCSDQIYSNY